MVSTLPGLYLVGCASTLEPFEFNDLPGRENGAKELATHGRNWVYTSCLSYFYPSLANTVVSMCVCQYIVAIVGTVSSVENLSAQKTSIAFV
jgi:hypothetical protein